LKEKNRQKDAQAQQNKANFEYFWHRKERFCWLHSMIRPLNITRRLPLPRRQWPKSTGKGTGWENFIKDFRPVRASTASARLCIRPL
jgi:hypothetical protein